MATPVTVITGASAGIGAALAHRLRPERSHALVLIARRKEQLEQLRQELGATHVHIFPLDITSRAAVEKTIAQIEETIGPIATLINNAGLAPDLTPAYRADLDDWEWCVAVNIDGLLYCTHAVLPHMVKRNAGHIINLGSVAGHYPYPGGNVYCGTKAFVHQFSLSLRSDLLGTEVRVTCIEPGLVGGTEFSDVRFRGDTERAKRLYEGAHALQPDDIAQVVQFCIDLPPHVNINTIELMPTSQAFSALTVHRS